MAQHETRAWKEMKPCKSGGHVYFAGQIWVSNDLSFAASTGVVAGDLPTRLTMILSTLIVAYYGNAVPFAGWTFVIAGLVSAAAWTVAPIDLATPLSIGMIGGAVLLVFGQCLLSRSSGAPGGRREARELSSGVNPSNEPEALPMHSSQMHYG